MSRHAHTISSSRSDEPVLVEGLLRNDAGAQAEFVTRSHHAVYALACRLSPDVDLRRDWTHDCLLRLLDDLTSGAFTYRHPGSFWSWFRKRAWFLLLESRRTHRIHTQREQTGGDDCGADRPAASNPERDLADREAAAAVEACIDNLASLDQRQALRLLLYQDLSYQEIADTVGAPLNTVRAWIRRGRLALRTCVASKLGRLSTEETS